VAHPNLTPARLADNPLRTDQKPEKTGNFSENGGQVAEGFL
jgi:hypothetical protein